MTTTLAIKILGAALILAILAIAVLVGLERTPPDILELLAASALSGLLGVLAPSRSTGDTGGDHRA